MRLEVDILANTGVLAPAGACPARFVISDRAHDPGPPSVRMPARPHPRRCLAHKDGCVVPFPGMAENDTIPDGNCALGHGA